MASPLLYDRIERAKERTRQEHFRNQLESSLKNDPEQNNVDVFVLSTEEVVELWLAKQRSRGKSDEKINARYQELVGDETVKLIKAQSSTIVGAARDSKNIAVLMKDFKRSGNVMGKYSTSVQGSRKYIIFKGNHKLRGIIKGNRYAASNPMLMKLGIGLRGATTLIKGNMLVTVIVSPFVNGYSWIFDPKFGWKDFLKGVSSDLVIAFLAGVAGALVFGAMALVTSTFVVPISLGVTTIAGISVTLGLLNMENELTDAVINSTVETYDYVASEAIEAYQGATQFAKRRKANLDRNLERIYYYIFDSDSGRCTVQKAEPKIEEELQGRVNRVTNS